MKKSVVIIICIVISLYTTFGCEVISETATEYVLKYDGKLGIELAPDLYVSRVMNTECQIEVGDRVIRADSDSLKDLEPRDAFQAIKESKSLTFLKLHDRMFHALYPITISVSGEEAWTVPSILAQGTETEKRTCRRRRMAFSKPDSQGCRDFFDGNYTDTIVVVDRGTCGFIHKVHTYMREKIAGFIVINSEDKIFFMQGFETEEFNFPIAMVSSGTGAKLRQLGSDALLQMGPDCKRPVPLTEEEKERAEMVVYNFTFSGKMRVGDEDYDFLTMPFSSLVSGDITFPSEKVIVIPYSPSLLDGFSHYATLYSLAIIQSPNTTLFPIDALLPSRITLPTIMVTHNAGVMIRDHSVRITTQNKVGSKWNIVNNIDLSSLNEVSRRRLMGRLQKMDSNNECWENHLSNLNI